MFLETINLTQICRTCKSGSAHMRNLFESYEDLHQSIRIDEILMACASIQVVHGDGLPPQICEICVEHLRKAFVFKRQCEDVDACLRQHLKNNHVTEMKVESLDPDFIEPINIFNNMLNKQQLKLKENSNSSSLVASKEEIDGTNQLICDGCDKIFTSTNNLYCHICVPTTCYIQDLERRYGKKTVFICKICGSGLTNTGNLKRHLVTHLQERPFTCKKCERGFNRIDNFNKHKTRCKGDKVFPCDRCQKSFNTIVNLERHKEQHDEKDPKLLPIKSLDKFLEYYRQFDLNDESDEETNKEGADIKYLAMSDEIASSEQKQINENVEYGEVEEEKEVKEVQVKLEVTCASMEVAEIPRESAVDNSRDNIEFKYLPKRSISSEERITRINENLTASTSENEHNSLNLITQIKNEKFESAQNDQDVSGRNNQKEFPCKMCLRNFTSKLDLLKHKKFYHRHYRLMCPKCGQLYGRKDLLVKHIHQNHRKELPLRCSRSRKKLSKKITNKTGPFVSDLRKRFWKILDDVVIYK